MVDSEHSESSSHVASVGPARARGDRTGPSDCTGLLETAPSIQILEGEVLHKRRWPREHGFRYPSFMLQLCWQPTATREPSVDFIAVDRSGLVSFHRADHGQGRTGSLSDWLANRLSEHGLPPDPQRVVLLAFPRMLGYTFKPVSFWFCYAAQHAQPYAIVCEVNNTFGEQHCYVLHRSGDTLPNGLLLSAPKAFHVSPFFAVEGTYCFRFVQQAGRMVARVELHGEPGLLLSTSVSGQVRSDCPRSAAALLRRYPMFTIGVIARIHWQAWLLWRKKIRFFSKPKPPAQPSTAGGPPTQGVS